ncbi:MAG: YjgP/YjgQ family permease [Ignavibacteria bacterium]|nr:YjgP/YjgQ family permease [Bacteroidota bacterium]MSQ45486.1 YjgP/YjgQ family permease [Ignavibacteria bacterium]
MKLNTLLSIVILHEMILFRYILKSHISPFVGAFATLMGVFVLQAMMKMLDQLIGKGINTFVIIELLLLNLAWIIVLAVPMAILIATLMGFGKLASQNEITALRANGVSLFTMMKPIVLFGILLTFLMVEFNNVILPEANHKLKTLMIDIRKKKPTLALTAGVFSQELQGYSMVVRKTFENSNNFEEAIIYDHRDYSKNIIISAKTGGISFSNDYQKIIVDLFNGEVHETSQKDPRMYRIVKFKHQRITTPAEGFEFIRSSDNAFTRGDRELSAGAMLYIVDSLQKKIDGFDYRINTLNSALRNIQINGFVKQSTPEDSVWQNIKPFSDVRSQVMMYSNLLDVEFMNKNSLTQSIREYMVEVHKKYSIPFACLIFVLVGAPLGVITRRSGMGVAGSISIGFFILYWAGLISGEKLADRQLIEPWLGMWMANIVLGLLGIALTFIVAKSPINFRLKSKRKEILNKNIT